MAKEDSSQFLSGYLNQTLIITILLYVTLSQFLSGYLVWTSQHSSGVVPVSQFLSGYLRWLKT